ncbi:MAG: sugar phosphate isomerase/epimerase family protein [Tissierella sp.]|uniref:sugar phosphate isomerase/epimerase family protein n=1 Tax=Tissierella sp. TaxID=41274 RepID=UPI003F980C13
MKGKFKIGMPALVECSSLNELVDLCLELKLDFIELNMNLPYNFIENINPQILKKITKETNVEFTMHMPDEADLGTFYESVRKGFVELFLDTLDWSFESGAKLLNLHIIEGAKMTLPDKKVYIYDQYCKEYLDKFIRSIKILSKRAEKYDVTLAIENSSNFGKTYIQKVLDKSIQYPNVKLTWDTGHDAVSDFRDRKYLMKNTEKIAHMHFHDARGKNDHQIPFDGDLNINELVSFARKNEIGMLIEVKTKDALKRSVEILRNKNII